MNNTQFIFETRISFKKIICNYGNTNSLLFQPPLPMLTDYNNGE